MAATFDSAYLLTMFNRLTGRPTSDSITDPTKYQRLTEAQNEIVADMAIICPNVLYPTVTYASIPTLTTADGGKTFTFGTDANSYSITPMGKAQIFASLNDIPTNPWRLGVDYVALGGTAIQIPNNNTYSGTLYYRAITNPADIDATHQPALFPEAARELIAIRAAYNFGQEGVRNTALSNAMAKRYGLPLTPDTGEQVRGRFAYWCATWKTQFQGGGALANLSGMQVAVGSSMNANAGF